MGSRGPPTRDGLSAREIQGPLAELCGLDVSPELVSAATDAILEDIAEWRNRPLDAVYPLIFFDALRLEIRDEGTVRNEAISLVLGVHACGRKEILGLWIEQTEGAKFWLRVMPPREATLAGTPTDRTEEPRRRGRADCRRRRPKGLPVSDHRGLPEAQVQTCIVPPVRNSLTFVSYKDLEAGAASLKETHEAAHARPPRRPLQPSPMDRGAKSTRRSR